MSRQPDRARSRRIVFAVAVFLAVVVTGKDDCGPPSATETLATLTLLPRLMGLLGRGLVLITIPDKANESECPPSR